VCDARDDAISTIAGNQKTIINCRNLIQLMPKKIPHGNGGLLTLKTTNMKKD